MPFDAEDEAGWNALPTVSDDNEESLESNIGPLHSISSCYKHALEGSGQVLTISSQPEKGKRVIELGAGCGLVGLVFAALGATVLLTDLPNVLTLLETNIAQNREAVQTGGGSVSCADLTWGITSVESLGQDWASPDLVVAADVVYHRELFTPLLHSISALGSEAVVLAHVRRWKSDAVFFKQLRKQFEVADITAEIQLDAAQFSSHTRGASRLFMLHHK